MSGTCIEDFLGKNRIKNDEFAYQKCETHETLKKEDNAVHNITRSHTSSHHRHRATVHIDVVVMLSHDFCNKLGFVITMTRV